MDALAGHFDLTYRWILNPCWTKTYPNEGSSHRNMDKQYRFSMPQDRHPSNQHNSQHTAPILAGGGDRPCLQAL